MQARRTPPPHATERRAAERAHRVPRPLPEPHRARHVARVALPPRDRLGRILEEWLADLPLGYTYSAD